MWNRIINLSRIVAGVVLVLIGVAAFLTPLTPGAWLAVVGLELLGVRVAYGPYLEAVQGALRRWRDRWIGK